MQVEIFMCIHMCSNLSTYVYAHTLVNVYDIYTYRYICMYVCMYVYIYIHIYFFILRVQNRWSLAAGGGVGNHLLRSPLAFGPYLEYVCRLSFWPHTPRRLFLAQ